jgi:hypothetical protein
MVFQKSPVIAARIGCFERGNPADSLPKRAKNDPFPHMNQPFRYMKKPFPHVTEPFPHMTKSFRYMTGPSDI